MRFEHFSGTHSAIGWQRGRAFHDLLHQSRQAFDTWSPETRRRVDSFVPVFESTLRQTAPELIEEVQGVAEGAGLPCEDILRLNFVEEIGVPPGCSQVGLADGDGGAICAKSEDAGSRRTYVVTELRPDRGYAQLHVGAVNWVVSSGGGINEAGLCIGQSSVRITDQADGIPRLTLLRLVLERCATVAEAVALFQSQDMALQGMNFLVVDAAGDMAVVERSPSQCAVRRPEDGAICSTNHYAVPQMRLVERGCIGSEPDLENRLAFEINTRQRYGRLYDFAKQHAGRTSLKEALEGLLKSHGPGGICQHGIMHTTLSMMMIPRRRELWATDGPSCRSTFQRYTFSNLP
jgi:predicted choloylglycine hydrolase